MSWKDKTVIRILLLVASFISRDEWKKEINSLASHISVNMPEAAPPAAKGGESNG